MKKRVAEPGGLSDQPPKRHCHQCNKGCDDVDAATHTSKVCLESLPAELLLLILEFSLEPSLIHTSRYLYSALPSFVPFTKAIAFTALSPQCLGEQTLDGLNLVKSTPSVLDDEQDRVRRAAFAGPWFQEGHLRHVHGHLLHRAILKACDYSTDGPSRGQRKRIKSFVDNKTEFSSTEQLNLRLRDEKHRPLNLHSTPLTVDLTAQHTTSVLRPVFANVLDFNGIVPDVLLRAPLTSSKLKLLQHISNRGNRSSRRSRGAISFNRQLLSTALLASIIDDDPLAFFTLFTIEAPRDSVEENLVLNLDHLEAAMRQGQTRMLIAILKRMWAYPRTFRPSDADLVDLINRARASSWPEWPKTTRICAMETASVWKAKQVEDIGGKVSHIPHAWPPELKICLPGQRAQTWFIPRDYRYDVDWENSSLGPWRPLSLYKDFTFLGSAAFAVLWSGSH